LGLFAANVADSRSTSKKLFHLRLHRRFHLDERRPGAFEAFAGELIRRVNAQLAADGDFAAGGIDGVSAVRDGGDVEDRIRLGQRLAAGVVAERAFVAQRHGRINLEFPQVPGVCPDEIFPF